MLILNTNTFIDSYKQAFPKPVLSGAALLGIQTLLAEQRTTAPVPAPSSP